MATHPIQSLMFPTYQYLLCNHLNQIQLHLGQRMSSLIVPRPCRRSLGGSTFPGQSPQISPDGMAKGSHVCPMPHPTDLRTENVKKDIILLINTKIFWKWDYPGTSTNLSCTSYIKIWPTSRQAYECKKREKKERKRLMNILENVLVLHWSLCMPT